MKFSQWREWWTERAPTYFTEKIWQFSQPHLIDRLEIQKDHRVLEIGFGYGRELVEFCKLSNHVFGLELTEWSCASTLEELSRMGAEPLPALSVCDGRKLPFGNDSFDVAYNCFVIQHLSREHAMELIRETIRVLKGGGKALFEFFGDPGFYDQGRDVYSGIPGQGGMYNNAYTEKELTGFIEEGGGRLLWVHQTPIAKNWVNYWVCFGK